MSVDYEWQASELGSGLVPYDHQVMTDASTHQHFVVQDPWRGCRETLIDLICMLRQLAQHSVALTELLLVQVAFLALALYTGSQLPDLTSTEVMS